MPLGRLAVALIGLRKTMEPPMDADKPRLRQSKIIIFIRVYRR